MFRTFVLGLAGCFLAIFSANNVEDVGAQETQDTPKGLGIPTQAKVADLPSGQITRIAFGSCAKHWQYQPIWKTIAEKNPNLFLFLGDAIYSDTDGKTAWSVTEKQLQGEWNRFADKPEFQKFRSQIPIMATWDNHDYGTHNGGSEFELKEASKRIFLDFFGESPDSNRRKTPGIFDARVFGPKGGRVQVILLDTRTFRGPFKLDQREKKELNRIGKVGKYIPQTDDTTTLLGEAQWVWLKRQLEQPADIRLVCSSTQIIPDEKGMDEWGCFPHERQRLFDLIQEGKANGVLLLTGNVHFAEVSKFGTDSYPVYEFTSSGLTHVNEKYAKASNRYRVAGPFAELNFGIVEIDWKTKSDPKIYLKAVDLDGATTLSQEISLSDLMHKGD